MTYNLLARRPFPSFLNELADFGQRYDLYAGSRNEIPVEVNADGSGVTVYAEVPGVNKDTISIDYSNRVLSILVDKKKPSEKSDGHYHYSEIRNGTLTRTIQLNLDIDFTKAEAVYIDGLLTITLPKLNASLDTKIQIK